jgi:hypothetical protein
LQALAVLVLVLKFELMAWLLPWFQGARRLDSMRAHSKLSQLRELVPQ